LPEAVDEVWPKVDDDRVAVGLPKSGWLRTLKASRRRSRFKRSWSGKMRETCESNWKKGGVRKAYEGFGIPLLEAMECGCPVLCGDSGSLPEVGGDAALYFNAANTSAIAAAMLTIAQSPSERSQLVHRGKDRAKHFSWDICAQQTFAIYERLTSNQ
jgi:glycosyltransferase involved in cell wall biosynthesis